MRTNDTLALVFEVSRGCQLNCQGCRVNKASSGVPGDAVLCNLLGLLHNVYTTGRSLAEIEFGPTDIMSAVNREEIFSNPLVKQIANLFSTVVLNTAMIHPDPLEYKVLAREVNLMAPKKPVGLVVPIEIKHVFNDKYIERIRENVETFKQALKYGFTEVIFSVIVDRQTLTNVGSRYTYEDLFAKVRELRVTENTAVDFALHQGRAETELGFAIGKNDLQASLRELNQHYLLDIKKRESLEKRHVPSMALYESEIREIVFHKDELYVRPIINERITLFHEMMRYTGGWTADELFDDFDQREMDNYNLALSVIKDCQHCPYVHRCTSRSVQQLMVLLGTRKCISPLPEFIAMTNE